MTRRNIMTIFGTRPEAIKMIPLIKCISKTPGLKCTICLTSQHREMLDKVITAFNVTADYDLNLMKSNQTLTSITEGVLVGLDKIFNYDCPDIVLVQGDTTTCFASALAAFYRQIPVGHVEAGLRTYNRYSPFPEEMNRSIVSRLATLHFAPTEQNVLNLKMEGITENVYLTGNTVIDLLMETVLDNYTFQNDTLRQINFDSDRIITLTVHRRENLGEPMIQILAAVQYIVDKFTDVGVVFPVHRNPAVSEIAYNQLGNHPRIHLIDPIDTVDMHNLMKRSYLVMTDSGGIQEEAPSLDTPVLVLRTETERPEAVCSGAVRIVGTQTFDIITAVQLLFSDNNEYGKMAAAPNPYGDGYASERIRDAILSYLEMEPYSL